MTPFWMIWKLGGGVPKFQHETEESARTEAYRLLQDNPYDTFYVLKALAEPYGPINTGPRPEPQAKKPQPQFGKSAEQQAEKAERDRLKAEKKAAKRAEYEARTGKKASTGEQQPKQHTTIAGLLRSRK